MQRLVSRNWWQPGRSDSQGYLARARRGAKELTDAIMVAPVQFFMQAGQDVSSIMIGEVWLCRSCAVEPDAHRRRDRGAAEVGRSSGS